MQGPSPPTRSPPRSPDFPNKEPADTHPARAVAKNLPDLVAACDAELARRPIDVDGPQAARHAEWARAAAGLHLRRTTEMAFRACKPSPQESIILPFIAANPDATFQALGKVYGKGDLGLAIGHLVYEGP